ncbi:MAG TPA: hypothetical protein VFT43_06830 [Candidatus Polarisedimenticolia bacterium]|nr:hypothetical protein [Candidatus Polarisedimenticolia bacterium]
MTSSRDRGPASGRRLAAFLLLLLAPALAAPSRAADPGATTANPHGAFVEDCALCHRADAWVPARISAKFNHARFGFPLEGAHARAECRACHASLDFSKEKPKTACVACHADVHQGELGADCARCHSARSFIDHARMVRAHQATRFPLTGAHLAADCEDCHRLAAQGHLTYVNLPSACESCHLNDYLATTNPNHVTGNIPRDCVQCHAPIAWVPARFANHDPLFFPIFSGTHRGRWTSCSDCHTNAGNYAQFECILCHAHDSATQMASNHSGVNGYQYNSQACYTCHPRGRAG